MPNAQRIVLDWEPRADRLEVLARQLHGALDWLGALPELEGSWTVAEEGTGASIPCATVEDAARCLALGVAAPRVAPGPDPDPAGYRQHFYLGTYRRSRAALTVLCGLGPASGLRGSVNYLDLRVSVPLGPVALRQATLGLVGIYRPVSGYAAAESFPTRSPATGAIPRAGWLTYLSAWFGPPPSLPAPALVSSLAHLGTLVQAFPEAFDPAQRPQLARVRELDATLRAQGVLRAYVGPDGGRTAP